MEQDIRFCTTEDGVGIAYAVQGEGKPLVRVLGWATHLEFETQMPNASESLWSLVARGRRIVRYDGRGFGLSDRGITKFKLEDKVRDLEAVIDAVGEERVSLLGTSEGGPTAILYANKHPDRVDKLILLGSFARQPYPETEEELQEARVRVMAIEAGWGKDTPEFRQLWATQFVPEGTPEMHAWFNELQKRSSDGKTVRSLVTELARVDVREQAKTLNVPTLVIHARGDRIANFERGRELAALIPGARLVPIDDNNHFPAPGSPAGHRIAQAVAQFLDGADSPSATGAVAAPGGLVTILFTDMESSTALTQRLGDEKAQELVRGHNTVVRDALKAYSGSEIKHTGDGIMASFPSARGALDAAVAIQRSLSGAEGPRVRVGLNAGEPVAEERDLFGTSVQLAARVCNEAEPGQILVSNVVRELAAGKQFLFSDRGDVVLRGFEDPVRLYEVSWQES
jgi:class 3 adenylate cyclase/pimeloyl-ACP methyl ester carboxylesterase